MTKINRIKELVELLNKASEAYYNTGEPIMSDKEFDELFEELQSWEYDTNFRLANSPTLNVGAKVLAELNEVAHNHPMLSLDKCHSPEKIIKFSNGKELVSSIKLDGLSTSLLYHEGVLVRAETRGDGYVGSDITEHVKQFQNVPLVIDKKGTYIIDGESVITDDDFAEINQNNEYKNSRNLASGTLSVLDTSLVKQRKLKFFAWDVIEGGDTNNLYINLSDAKNLGFDIVPDWWIEDVEMLQDKELLQSHIDYVFNVAEAYGLPCDGVVFKFADIKYGKSLGATGHHFRNGCAFKRKDKAYETELLDIEWTVGRTSQITPTAVFKPVVIDGTTVERASVHNVSVLTQLDLHIGDRLEIVKSNQIIPQVNRNISAEDRINTDYIVIPATCPVCGGTTEIKTTDNSKILVCTNPDCAAKKLAQFTHFVSKNCMDIRGLSEATLETFISKGYLKTFKDIYGLHKYRNELIHLDGFGPKSIDKLLTSIEKSREVKLENFIAALGIPNIGLSAAKAISQTFGGDHYYFVNALSSNYDFTQLDDFGETMNKSLHDWWDSKDPMVELLPLEMNFIIPEKVEVKENPFTGKNVCVTGKLHSFTRNSINEKIVLLGAKAVGSVSSKTDYLITNEQSGSSKYKKAVELNIPIITEDEFLEMLGE